MSDRHTRSAPSLHHRYNCLTINVIRNSSSEFDIRSLRPLSGGQQNVGQVIAARVVVTDTYTTEILIAKASHIIGKDKGAFSKDFAMSNSQPSKIVRF